MSFAAKARAALTPATPHYDAQRTALDLLLSRAYLAAGNGDAALPPAEELLAGEPDSDTALMLVTRAHALNKTGEAWVTNLHKKLEGKPSNPGLLRATVEGESSVGNFTAARVTQQRILDGGHATESDYNQFAWLGLFNNDLGDDTVKAARQAVTLGKNSSFASLHTLASVYAAQGHIAEAHATLLQAMNAANISTPSAPCWYVLGVIERQLGLNQDAAASFAKVKNADPDLVSDNSATSTWVLAQRELKALGK